MYKLGLIEQFKNFLNQCALCCSRHGRCHAVATAKKFFFLLQFVLLIIDGGSL